MTNASVKTIGEYKVMREKIARGASGCVHEAIATDGERVALKVLDRQAIEARVRKENNMVAILGHGSFTQDPDKTYSAYAKRFKEEYKTLLGLSHPNVAKVREIGFHENELFIAYEFIEGKPIAEFVRGWNPVEMIPLFLQALAGLDFIHRSGLLHLDIKSENILVDVKSGTPQVKIIDFGLATPLTEYHGDFLGSPSSIAPEVALGKTEQVDYRADLFSFGVVMYYCCTWGQLPFARPSGRGRESIVRAIELESTRRPYPPSFAHHHKQGFVPEYIDEIIMRLISHSPSNRFYGNSRAVMNAILSHNAVAFGSDSKNSSAYLVPEANKHIGRTDEQAAIEKIIEDLLNGQMPAHPIMAISGASGLGKSHLLSKAREAASSYSESVSVHSISLPTEETLSDAWLAHTQISVAEGKRSHLIMIDDAHETLSSKKKSKIADFLKNLICLAVDRAENTHLFSNYPPLAIIFTFDQTKTSHKELITELKVDERFITFSELKPLGYLEIDEYLRATPAFKNVKIPRERVDEIYSLTNGIPAEIRELLEIVDSKGVLFNLEGDLIFSIPTRPERIELPTAEERVYHSLQKFDDDDRRILNFLSVWGVHGIASPATFNDIFNFLPINALKQKLHLLVQKGMLFSNVSNGSYEFANKNYIADIVYRSIDPEEAINLHEKIAKYLIKHNSDVDSIDLHLALGRPGAKSAKSALILTSRFLFQNGELGRAKKICEHAISTIPFSRSKLRAIFISKLGQIYMHEGKISLAVQAFENALGSIPENAKALRLSILTKLAAAKIRTQNFTEAQRFLGVAFLFSKRRLTPAHITLLNLAGRMLYERSLISSGNSKSLLERAGKIFEQTLEMQRILPPKARSLVVGNDLGLTLLANGHFEKAVSVLEEQVAQFERDQNHFSVLKHRLELSSALRLSGFLENAVTIAESCVKLSKKTYHGRWLLHAHQTLAYAYHDLDKFPEAIDEDDRWYAISALVEGEVEHARSRSKIYVHKGHCYKELKRFDRALLCFQSAIQTAKDPFTIMYASEGLGECHFAMGDLELAKAELIRSMDIAKTLPKDGSAPYIFNAGALLVEAYAKTNMPEEAKKIIADISAIAKLNKNWMGKLKELQALCTTADQV